jgi:hypothetical protein
MPPSYLTHVERHAAMHSSFLHAPQPNAPPLTLWILIIGGTLTGAASWAIPHTITGVFEPFDDSVALLLCQATLAPLAFYAGLRAGFLRSALGLLCAWAGMNAYAYLFGSSETRAWIVLLMFGSLTLLLLPAVAMTIAAIARVFLRKLRKSSPPADDTHDRL